MFQRRSLLLGLFALVIAAASLGALALLRGRPVQAQGGAIPKIVYSALSKDFRGEGQMLGVSLYGCHLPDGTPVQMKQVKVEMIWPFQPHDCDEPKTKGVIRVKWNTTLRTDQGHFGTHHGTFTYTDSMGNVGTGRMSGTIGCGTHRMPSADGTECEKCREPNHFEGFLTGHFTSGPWAGNGMQASYQGEVIFQQGTTWPTPQKTAPVLTRGTIDGVYVLKCKPVHPHNDPR